MEITMECSTIKRITYKLAELEVKDALVRSVRNVSRFEVPPGGAWTFAWYRDEDSGRLCVEMIQTLDGVQVTEEEAHND